MIKICYLAHGQSPHTIKWIKYFCENLYEVHLISFAKPDFEIEGLHIHLLNQKNENPKMFLSYLL